MAKKMYWFCFEDGYRVATYGYDRVEMMHEVRKHGKLLGKYPAE